MSMIILFLFTWNTKLSNPPPIFCISIQQDSYLSLMCIYLYEYYYRYTNANMDGLKERERDNVKGLPMLNDHNHEEWLEILMRGLLHDLEIYTWFCVPPYAEPNFETEEYEHFEREVDGIPVATVLDKWRGESDKTKWRLLLQFNEDRRNRWKTSLSDIVVKKGKARQE